MKNLKRVFATLLVVPLALFGGCSSEKADPDVEESSAEETVVETGPVELVDAVGRTVTLDQPAQSVVAIGPAALRMVVYGGGADKVVGVEQWEVDSQMGRPYALANPDFAELPVIGQGGPNNAPSPEEILNVNPDIVFTTYAADAATADEFAEKIGVPVFVLPQIGQTAAAVFDGPVLESITNIGQLLGTTEHAQGVVQYIADARDDLQARTADIPEADRPSVYVGGVGMRGSHGIESTQGSFAVLDVINAKNIADEAGTPGPLTVDREQILAWNPDILIIDLGGIELVREDYGQNPDFYNELKAVSEGRTYVELPYNFYGANIDTALADAYFLGTVIYPDQFADVDPEAKADEIYEALVGAPVYEHMKSGYGAYGLIEW
ncbi:MAG: iron ABC transporter substrate-binding protein [Actinomycetaceae bacterium]|nr:iron ABC transporter substrate-binding protein [Actinomycetaceae bacterium]